MGQDGMVDIDALNQPQVPDIIVTEIMAIREDITSIKNEMSNMKKEVKEQYIKISLSLDKIHKMISDNDQFINRGARIAEQTPKEDLLGKFNFPLSTCQEISKLEEEIRKNGEFKSQLVEFLSRIGGVSGEEDGGKIAYKIVDSMFSSDVLMNYSWTGVARGKSGKLAVEKNAFQSLEGILAIFFEVLLLADNRHTKQKNASLFKDGVLKHAKKRSQRKRPKTGDGKKRDKAGIDNAENDGDMPGNKTKHNPMEVDGKKSDRAGIDNAETENDGDMTGDKTKDNHMEVDNLGRASKSLDGESNDDLYNNKDNVL